MFSCLNLRAQALASVLLGCGVKIGGSLVFSSKTSNRAALLDGECSSTSASVLCFCHCLVSRSQHRVAAKMKSLSSTNRVSAATLVR